MNRTGMIFTAIMMLSAGAYGSFETENMSARVEGLGGAFTGLADTSEGVFYNAAGISRMEQAELRCGYGRMFAGLSDDSTLGNGSLAAAYPLKGRGCIGAGINTFNLDGYYRETMVGIYFGRALNGMFSVGGGIKYMDVEYGKDEYTALNPVFQNGQGKAGVSLDIGVLARPAGKWTVGLSVRDVNEPDMGIKYPEPLLKTFTAGVAYRSGKGTILIDGSVQGSDTRLKCGWEKRLGKGFTGRIGAGIGNRLYEQVCFGGGYQWDAITVDYGFMYALSGISNTCGTHVVSLGYRFGESAEEMEAARSKEAAAREAAKKHAQEEYAKSIRAMEAGDYAASREAMDEANRLDGGNELYETMYRKLKLVSGFVTKAEGDGKKEGLIRKGIKKYAVENAAKSSVNMLLYAYSLDMNDENIRNLAREIEKENNMPAEKILGRWTLVEQKENEALDAFRIRNYTSCIGLCEEILELEPRNCTAFKRLGSVYYVLGDKERARLNWEKVLELTPDDAGVARIRQLLEKLK